MVLVTPTGPRLVSTPFNFVRSISGRLQPISQWRWWCVRHTNFTAVTISVSSDVVVLQNNKKMEFGLISRRLNWVWFGEQITTKENEKGWEQSLNFRELSDLQEVTEKEPRKLGRRWFGD